MNSTLTVTRETLHRQTRAWRGTGGISEETRGTPFKPAFKDLATGRTYLACFADGTPAPMHLLDGLPEDVVVERDGTGCPFAVKNSIVAGFLRCGRFYTREQAAAHCTCAFDR